MSNLIIGILSGTSMDAVDAAIVDFSTNIPRLVATHAEAMPATLKQELLALCHSGDNEIHRMGEADIQVALLFSNAVKTLLQKAKLSSKEIAAIGSHGQNIRHSPNGQWPFTLQIGDPNTIATQTGILTVADFRRKDIALGGQGAPLAPGFHNAIFAHEKPAAVVNIGGIANITLLQEEVSGFDTGPGNTLMDAWIREHQQKEYDQDGAWARSGKSHPELLAALLQDPYFKKSAPKSTGVEYFNRAWLSHYCSSFKNISPADVQATLVDLTAKSIAMNVPHKQSKVIICGGGAHNTLLMEQLKKELPQHSVESSAHYGLNPNWIEAMLFAWLAKQTLEHKPGNLPRVTGAKKSGVLGGIYFPD